MSIQSIFRAVAILSTVLFPPAATAQGQGHSGNSNGGSSDCVQWCVQNLPPGPARSRCISEAAQGRGPCFHCGPAGNNEGLCGGVCCDVAANEDCHEGRCTSTVPCCLPTGACEVLDILDCLNNRGQPQASVGYTCADVGGPVPPCPPPGACCVPNGGCLDLTPSGCIDQGGLFVGFGNTCAATTCPRGACCLPNDHNGCELLSQPECDARGGLYRGDLVECTACTGACCYPFAGCTDAVLEGPCEILQEGVFLGIGTTCTPGTCPVGACCLPTECTVTIPSYCAAHGGTYFGDGTTCPTPNCLVPCCRNGECVLLEQCSPPEPPCTTPGGPC